VVKARQASHHLLGAEPLQGLKVEVPETLVPLPRLVPTSGEANWLCDLRTEDVESISASGYQEGDGGDPKSS
jgi:glycine cleavage system H lipoate-binding protein